MNSDVDRPPRLDIDQQGPVTEAAPQRELIRAEFDLVSRRISSPHSASD